MKKMCLYIVLISLFNLCTSKKQQETVDFDLLNPEQKSEIIEKTSADILKDSTNPDLYSLRGRAYFATGEYYKAVQDFMNALRNTNDFETKKHLYINLGKSWLNLEKPDSAYSFFRGAGVLDYKDADAYGYMSIAAGRMELYQLAFWPANLMMRDFRHSEVFSLDSLDVLKNIFSKKAFRDLPDPDSIYSDNPLIYEDLAYYLAFKEKYDKAVKLYTKAINLRQERMDSLSTESPLYELEKYILAGDFYMRGNNRNSKGDSQKAIDDYNTAIDIYKGNWYFYQNRGFSYHLKEMDNEAMEDFTKAIEIDPGNESSYHYRALTYLLSGDKKRAMEDAKIAKKLNPYHPAIDKLISDIQKAE